MNIERTNYKNEDELREAFVEDIYNDFTEILTYKGEQVIDTSDWTLDCFLIDGYEFQIRETACNTFIEGPKTLTIKNAIEEEKAKIRKMKKEAKEREQKEQEEKIKKNLQKEIDRQNVKTFLLSLWDEIGGVLEDGYAGVYAQTMEREATDYIKDNIDDPWRIINDDWLTDTIWKIITQ